MRALADQYGDLVLTLPLNVDDKTAVDRAVAQAIGRFGRIERITRADGRWTYQLEPPGSPFLFTKVFGAAYVHLTGDLGELARRYRPGAPAQAAGGTVDLLDLNAATTVAINRLAGSLGAGTYVLAQASSITVTSRPESPA